MRTVIHGSSVGTIFRDPGNMEQVLEDSGFNTQAVHPVALVNGDASGSAQIVDRFEKKSKISTRDVAQWMLDAVERPTEFEQRTKMIGASNLPRRF